MRLFNLKYNHGFPVTMQLINKHVFKWDRVYGVQIGNWFIGGIRGHKIQEEILNWMDISTAPKDGTQILLYHKNSNTIFAGRWNSKAWVIHPSNRTATPTHWTILPAPPFIGDTP